MRAATRWLVWSVVAVAAAAVLVWAVPDVAPDGDIALIDTYVLHVLGPGLHVGAYSRFGWNHPGPLYFQILAPLYALGGVRHLAVLLTVAALNGACVIGIVWRLWRRNAAVAVAAFVLLAAYAARMNGLLASSWNPHAAELPLALLVVTAAETAVGSVWLLPLDVALASFVAQTHAASAPLVAVLLVVAATAVRFRTARRPLAAAAVVGTALWALPLWDELSASGAHNLSQLAHFARASVPRDPAAASRLFWRLASAPFVPGASLWNPAPTATLDAAHDRIARLTLVQVCAFVVAGAGWALRRRRFETVLVLTIAAAGAAAFWTAQRTPETPQAYTMLWAAMLGVLAWSAAAGAVLEAALRAATLPRTLLSIMTAVTIALCAWHVVIIRADDAARSARSLAFSRAVQSDLDAQRTRDVLVHIPQAYWGVATGTVLQLYRSGIVPHVDADWVSMFGRTMAPTGRERTGVQFASAEDRATDLDHRATHRLLAEADGFSVFAVAPDPAGTSAPLALADRTDDIETPERLGDGVTGTGGQGPASPASVGFIGRRASVLVALPPRAIAIGAIGQPNSLWDLRCETPAPARPLGQLRLGDAPDVARDTAYPRALDGCHALRLSPVADGVLSWLTEVTILTAP